MKDLNVKFHVFEGPLDLLYHLVEKNEIDIYDIPIAELAEQYIAYISQMQSVGMESMSEFLVMAATLLEIKSKMLLPRSREEAPEEEDPRDRLMQHLLEYKLYKDVTEIFRENRFEAEKLYFREPGAEASSTVAAADEFLDGLSLKKLYETFEDILRRKEMKTDKIRASFDTVRKDIYNIRDKMAYIEELLEFKDGLKFSEFFFAGARKMEMVVTFLAALELIRMKRITIKQDENFGEIIIKKA